jgi:hypothetical protein
VQSDHNPYSPPQADLTIGEGTGTNKMFSPTQTWLAAYLGGPLVATYMIRKNFLALGRAPQARNTLIYGLLLSLLVILVLPFVPEKTPNFVIPVLYAAVAQYVTATHQLTKKQILASSDYGFQSNWKVLLVSLLGVLLFLAAAFPWIYYIEGMEETEYLSGPVSRRTPE